MTKSGFPRVLAVTSLITLALAACNSILGNKERPLVTGGSGGNVDAAGGSGETSGASGKTTSGGISNGGAAGAINENAGETGGGAAGAPSAGDAGAGTGGASTGGVAGSTGGGGATMNGGGAIGGSPPACGNGLLETGEACDDGNHTAADGCSATCIVEPGFACNGTPSACNRSCNGLAKTCGSSGNSDCCASNVVTGGTFKRGNDASYPATVADFRLDNYEITSGRFKKFVATYAQPAAGSGKNPNNSSDPGWDATWNTGSLASAATLEIAVKCAPPYQTYTATNEAMPMNCLNWFEAEAFCIWDGGRLPTEAEWNYAAAGGALQHVYSWGDAAPGSNVNLAIYGCLYPSGSGTCTGIANLAPVGSVSAGNGQYGQADLSGNVWEWAQDWYATPYVVTCNNCADNTAATERVVRGGSFNYLASYLFSSYRSHSVPSGRTYDVGARCARAR